MAQPDDEHRVDACVAALATLSREDLCFMRDFLDEMARMKRTCAPEKYDEWRKDVSELMQELDRARM